MDTKFCLYKIGFPRKSSKKRIGRPDQARAQERERESNGQQQRSKDAESEMTKLDPVQPSAKMREFTLELSPAIACGHLYFPKVVCIRAGD